MSQLPESLPANAIFVPSGDQAGRPATAPTGSPCSSPIRLLTSKAGTVMPKTGTVSTIAARVPSGAIATLPWIPSGKPNAYRLPSSRTSAGAP